MTLIPMDQNRLEGILVQKTPYQDRHVVGKILLRNGQLLTSLFYGGQGGGKKNETFQSGARLLNPLSNIQKVIRFFPLSRMESWLESRKDTF